ncbi:serine hydrolase domain-containing protein [candidate division KSB1 bacterium]
MKNISLIKTLTVALVVFLLISSASAYQAYPHNELTDQVDRLFERWDKDDSPGLALGIFKDGRIIYARGYGMANLEYGIPNTPQTVFRTGSVSKQFTAMCIAILADQGKLSLDDNIRRFIPEMPEYETPVTIRHLVHHTSGVRDYLTLQSLALKSDADYYTNQDVLDIITWQKELNFPPGDQYLYSNSGYFLLAEIIARASGMPTKEFAEKYIFEPLGMNNTHFHDDRNLIVKNRASGYSPSRGGYRISMTQLEMIGDGGVFTTMEDMFEWDNNFYDNMLGSPGLMNVVLTPGIFNDGTRQTYAFGLRVDKYRGIDIVGHGGAFVGFRAANLQFPDHKFSVVILANTSAINPSALCERVADIYLENYFTEPKAVPQRREGTSSQSPENINLPVSELRKYVGEYYSEELRVTYIIELVDDKLKFTHRNTPGAFFMAVAENEFIVRGLRVKFTGGRNSGFEINAGRVQHIRFNKIK